jgi:hypothetical protein
MEAFKGIAYNHGEVDMNGKKAYKYLIGMVLITDTPITDIGSETIITKSSEFSFITSLLETSKKYKPEHVLGELSDAITQVSEMTPSYLQELKEIEEENKGS